MMNYDFHHLLFQISFSLLEELLVENDHFWRMMMNQEEKDEVAEYFDFYNDLKRIEQLII